MLFRISVWLVRAVVISLAFSFSVSLLLGVYLLYGEVIEPRIQRENIAVEVERIKAIDQAKKEIERDGDISQE